MVGTVESSSECRLTRWRNEIHCRCDDQPEDRRLAFNGAGRVDRAFGGPLCGIPWDSFRSIWQAKSAQFDARKVHACILQAAGCTCAVAGAKHGILPVARIRLYSADARPERVRSSASSWLACSPSRRHVAYLYIKCSVIVYLGQSQRLLSADLGARHLPI